MLNIWVYCASSFQGRNKPKLKSIKSAILGITICLKEPMKCVLLKCYWLVRTSSLCVWIRLNCYHCFCYSYFSFLLLVAVSIATSLERFLCNIWLNVLFVPSSRKAAKASIPVSSLFSQSNFYGFIAPHLRKSKQETNAPNSIPDTSGKCKRRSVSACFRGKHCSANHMSLMGVTACRLPILRTQSILYTKMYLLKEKFNGKKRR